MLANGTEGMIPIFGDKPGDQVGSARHGDYTLAAAAPDLAQTVAGMTYEYAVQIESPRGGWILTGAPWQHSREGAEEELRNPLVVPRGWNARLVRRLVSNPEVIDND